MEKKYNYFYKITNIVNGHFYYGIHSTDNIDDGYMGSGVAIKNAIKKYGIENFEKEILKFFETRKEASDYEEENVTMSLIKENDCYNVIPGGDKYPVNGMITVFDSLENKNKLLDIESIKLDRGRYRFLTEGMIPVKENGIAKLVSKQEYYNNKDKYKTNFTESVVVKDKNGKVFIVNKNDERWKRGELISLSKGRKHTEEWSNNIKVVFKNIEHQKGIKNSQYGTKWVHNDKEVRKIKGEEIEKYLSEGWRVGKKDKIVKEHRNPKYKEIDADLAYSLHENGLSWNKVAEELGVSIHVIERFLRWKRGKI